jgi:drug/metabolite transporter (DMT)-like permease
LLYYNIGGKIKGLAKVIGIGGAVLSGLAFFICLIIAGANDEWEEMAVGIIALLVLVPVCIIGSYLLYGFGELIEKVSRIADGSRIAGDAPTHTAPAPSQSYVATSSNDLPEL